MGDNAGNRRLRGSVDDEEDLDYHRPQPESTATPTNYIKMGSIVICTIAVITMVFLLGFLLSAAHDIQADVDDFDEPIDEMTEALGQIEGALVELTMELETFIEETDQRFDDVIEKLDILIGWHG